MVVFTVGLQERLSGGRGVIIRNALADDLKKIFNLRRPNMIKKLLKNATLYKKIWSTLRLKNVPVERIRCQERPFSDIQGFSAKTIDNFPPCKYFQLYLINKKEAHIQFARWLYHCLVDMRAWEIEREIGGWKNGSLVKLIYKMHKEAGIDLKHFVNAEDRLIRKAIDQKVDHYLSVLKSIKEQGYNRNMLPPITAIYKNGLYYLKEGHHRVSSLYVLGYKSIRIYIE